MRIILDRYVFREFIPVWLTTCAVLFALVLASQYTRALERAADAGLPSDVVPRLALFTLAQSAAIVIPVTLVTAIVLAVGRLYHDGEITAIEASGISAVSAVRSVTMFSLGAAACLGWFTLSLSPSLARAEQTIILDALRRAQQSVLEPGHFAQIGRSALVIHIDRRDADGSLRGIFIARRSAAKWETVTASRASYRSIDGGAALALQLREGIRVEGEPGSSVARRFQFAEYNLRVPLPSVERMRSSRDSVATEDLANSARAADRAEFQWRLSVPLMCAILGLAAVPLARLKPRQGRYAAVAPALLVVFVYISFLGAARSMLAAGRLPEWPGLLYVHAAMLGILGLWLGRSSLRSALRRAL